MSSAELLRVHRQPGGPRRVGGGDRRQAQALPRQRAPGGLAAELIPQRPGRAVVHQLVRPIEQPARPEAVHLALQAAVVDDRAAAQRAVGQRHRHAADRVVDHLVRGDDAHREGARVPVDRDAHDLVLGPQPGRGLRRAHVRRELQRRDHVHADAAEAHLPRVDGACPALAQEDRERRVDRPEQLLLELQVGRRLPVAGGREGEFGEVRQPVRLGPVEARPQMVEDAEGVRRRHVRQVDEVLVGPRMAGRGQLVKAPQQDVGGGQEALPVQRPPEEQHAQVFAVRVVAGRGGGLRDRRDGRLRLRRGVARAAGQDDAQQRQQRRQPQQEPGHRGHRRHCKRPSAARSAISASDRPSTSCRISAVSSPISRLRRRSQGASGSWKACCGAW